MTSANPLEDLNLGRTWLNRAAEMLDGCEDHQSDAEFARAAAIIGNGFIALAHAERAAVSMAETSQVRQAILTMSDEPETTLAEAIEREKRAEAEARPHDDEPVNLCESDADMAARFAGQVGELTSRIDDALSWLDEPDDATPEIQLAKIRAALTGESRRG